MLYLTASNDGERATSLQEFGRGPKADKMRERLLYIQNFKSAAMLYERAQEHANNINRGIDNSQEKPTKLAVFLSRFSNIEKRVNLLHYREMINKEIRKRTRVASIFPNEVSCLPLVSAILMELSDDWEFSRAFSLKL